MSFSRNIRSAAVLLAATVLLNGLSFGVSADENAKTVQSSELPEQVTFNAHIRPIMSNTCFACHGPDEDASDNDFRIDSYKAATSPLESDDSLVGIKPGDASASEVYLRITGKSDGEQMPPEHFLHKLTEYDKALFKKWIDQGAQYEKHWSYAPIKRPATPAAESKQNPIDAFIQARLERKGLKPSPPADKATLLRRLSLDLIGLPPTIQQREQFLADESDQAYENAVDRLLSSEHFGERMASFWLDLVRFADTVGYHGDQNSRVFPYRDYVIESFNRNKPFDQFTREQIAGDLLDNPTSEQLVATGLLRLNMVTREGGAQPGEYLAKYKADRVRTIGTAWLGSTMGCCECHNHKYDPFSAKDFYSMGAFFDDLRQWGVYSSYGYTPNEDLKGFNNDYPFPPEIRVSSPSLIAEINALQTERDQQLLRELGNGALATDDFKAWKNELANTLTRHPSGWLPANIIDTDSAKKTQLQILDDGSVLATGEAKQGDVITLSTTVAKPTRINAIRLEVLPDEHNNGFVGRGQDGRFEVAFSASISADTDKVKKTKQAKPRFVRIELPGNKKILSLAEVQVFAKDKSGKSVNIALDGKATQSTTYKGEAVAERAIDGETEGDYYKASSVTHTAIDGNNPWWEVDLGSSQTIERIVLWNRTDGDYAKRLNDYRVVLLDDQHKPIHLEKPGTPKPSTQVKIPSQLSYQENSGLDIAWTEADRRNPKRYSSGRPPRTVDGTWRSGPARWQLPVDETRLAHTAIYHLARPTLLKPGQTLEVKLSSADIGRVRLSLTSLGHAIAGWDAAPDGLRDAVSANGLGGPEQQALLLGTFLRSTQAVGKQHPTHRFYRDRILELHSGLAMSLVAQPLAADKIPASRVLPRGNWQDETGEAAPPGVPHFLPQPNVQKERLNRLDLANWLTSANNPLTPRHYVNRTWKQFFGTGLSAKLDDIGNQGEWPSHPELLDWMAAEFVDSGWDMKHMVRLMVTSNTYRQSAAVRSDLSDIDPYNRLLSQQSPRRLEAEIVRDNALAISGLLVANRIGGPSVFPYQPPGHYGNLQFPNRKYQPSNDARQYRRGVYMHWQRTFLHPMLVNFDAPSRDECTADRPMSNSPQQALTLLNDPSFVETSRAMSTRILSSNPDQSVTDWIKTAYLTALTREPNENELAGLSKLYASQLGYFTANSDEARKFMSVGNRPLPEGDKVRLAAFAQVCRVILNLHETITRY